MVFPVVLSTYPLGKVLGVELPKLATQHPPSVYTLAIPGMQSCSTCCIVWRPGTALPVTMVVEWTYGYEKDFDTGQLLREAETHRAEVELKGPVSGHPTVFVVHFYPNNTVQLEVAEDYPKPRLKRSELEQGAKP